MLKERPKTDTIIVTSTQTDTSSDLDVDDIDKLHRLECYQYGIGHHFVIRRNGRLQRGRPISKIGGHLAGWDQRAVTVCLVGGAVKGHLEDNFTSAQRQSLENCIDLVDKSYPNCQVIFQDCVLEK